LVERGLHDAPDRPEDLSAKVLGLSDKTDGLSAKRGWIGKEHAITVALTAPDPTSSPGVGDVGSVGTESVGGSEAKTLTGRRPWQLLLSQAGRYTGMRESKRKETSLSTTSARCSPSAVGT
jgi:hypothetical protein